MSTRWAVPGLVLAVALGVLTGLPAPAPAEAGPAGEEWNQAVDRAVAYLRKTQAKDGSWGAAQSPGITGIVLTGLLRTGRVGPKDPMVEKALQYVESLINPKAGHIAGKDPRLGLQNYVT